MSQRSVRFLQHVVIMSTVLILCTAAGPHPAGAVEPSSLPSIDLAQGKSDVLQLPFTAGRVSIGSPDIAEILLISPRQIYITARAPGVTNLTVWTAQGTLAGVYDIRVTPDIARLKEMLYTVLPAERRIQVLASGENITLSGTVSSANSLSTAAQLAEQFAPEHVTNLLSVGGVHQVMLEVRIAEMHRNVMERMGIDLAAYFDGNFAFTMLNDLFKLDNQRGPLSLGENASNAIVNSARTGLFQLSSGQASVTGFLDILKNNGLVKILAEPTLVCRSGEDAQFLAGGEIPIPIPQGLGTVAIEYKQYGVSLVFSPTVIDGDRISLKVFPEVSELDFANALSISGFNVPALTSRRASTLVELGNGQSFAIAGLLRDEVRETIKKYPGLGDVPVLGTLFRSSEFQKSETELVIIVTPHLAKPLDSQNIALPTDHFIEPTELEFFYHGKMYGEAKQEGSVASIKPAIAPQGQGALPKQADIGMDGSFGHIIPAQ